MLGYMEVSWGTSQNDSASPWCHRRWICVASIESRENNTFPGHGLLKIVSTAFPPGPRALSPTYSMM